MKNKLKEYKLKKDDFVNPLHTYTKKNTPKNLIIIIYEDVSEKRFSGYVYFFLDKLMLEIEEETAQNYKTFDAAANATKILLKKEIDKAIKLTKQIHDLNDWYADNFHRI